MLNYEALFFMSIQQIFPVFEKYKKISTDSRAVDNNALFFALKGENFNGNKFASIAIDNGASIAIIDDPNYHIEGKTILVHNTLETLQQLAKHYREKFHIPFIGITGSNGKTTTKELINAVLKEKYKSFATKGNLNNHIGVPITLLSIPNDTEIAIIEMGANHIGEIEILCNLAKPSYGIITNIGKAHIEGFGSLQGVIKAKGELYNAIDEINGTLFINGDDPLLNEIAPNVEKYTYGLNPGYFISAEIISIDPFIKIKIHDKHPFTIETKLLGKYNINNILAAVCIGRYFEVPSRNIKAALESYIPKNNRSEIRETKKNTLLLDAYNANPSSMKVAIDNFMQMQHSHEKFMILGSMLELGAISKEEHQNIVNLLLDYNFKKAILIGDAFTHLNTKHFPVFSDVFKAKKYLKKHPICGKFLLLKGSRGIQLEKLLEEL